MAALNVPPHNTTTTQDQSAPLSLSATIDYLEMLIQTAAWVGDEYLEAILVLAARRLARWIPSST